MSFTWVSTQNLIGGMALGFERVFGTPERIVTNGIYNDSLYIDYMNRQRGLNIPVVKASPDFSELEESVPEVDVIAMTPACSGLSMMTITGTTENAPRSADNKNNLQMLNILRYALKSNPRVVAFENAPNLYTGAGKIVRERLLDIAREYGYSMGLYQTNCMLHGMPQQRKRTFAVFYRDSNPAVFEYENVPYQNWADFVREHGKKMKMANRRLINVDTPEFNFVLERTGQKNFNDAVRMLIDQGKLKKMPMITAWEAVASIGIDDYIAWAKRHLERCSEGEEKLWKHAVYDGEHLKEKMEKGSWIYDMSAISVNADFQNALIAKNQGAIHPDENRFLSIGEALALMGFPEDYEFQNDNDFWIIGQNVPVCTAEWIAKNVKKYLEGKLQTIQEDFLQQSNIKQRIDVGTLAA